MTEREREARIGRWGLGWVGELGRRNISTMRELASELRDEAAVGRALARTASVSLRDGESEPDSFREVRWKDRSLRVMRERTVR